METSSGPAPASGALATGTAVPPPFPSTPVPLRPLGAGLLLAALAAAALVLARRRRRAPRLVEIVESASLGPKRSLVVARMGGELLLLGSSEGGITLLSTRSAPVEATAAAPSLAATPASAARSAEAARLTPVAGLLSRLGLVRDAPPAPAAAESRFDLLLAECVEDVELRRKLAAGNVGSVR